MKCISTTSILLFLFVAAFSQAGTLDNSFSTDGKTVIGFRHGATKGTDDCYSMALQPDGKIILAGFSNATGSGFNDFVIVRLNLDGTFDHSFNSKGFRFIDFSGFDDEANAVAIQSDGKIVVAGTTHTSNGRSRIGLSRLLSNGALDPLFGPNFSGKVITDPGTNTNTNAFGLVIQQNGKIVVAGSFFKINTECILARYNTDGSPDQSFGVLGTSITGFGAGEFANSVAIQNDGKIVAGCTNIPFSNSHFLIARFTSAGFLDNTFGTNGKVITKVGSFDYCAAVVLQSNGKIVAMGYGILSNSDFVVLRYDNTGSLDNTFSNDGIVTTDFGSDDGAFAAAIQSDGKIVVAGSSTPDFALARYNANGTLDHTFSSDGKITTNFGQNEHAYGVALMNNGKIVAAGTQTTSNSSNDNFAIARYHGDNAAPEFVTSESNNENKIVEEKISSVHLYPNPVTDILHVEGLNASSPVTLSISNLSGTVIQTVTVAGSEYSFNTGALKSGMYYLNVTRKDDKLSFRFLKE